MRLIPLVPGAIGARPVGTLPAAWCFFFFFFLAGCHVLVWLGAGWQTAFLLLRRKTAINGPRWRGIGGSQLQWEEELGQVEEEKRGGAEFNWGGWRHAMAAAAAKLRSVEAFMLLALLCLFFFLAGRKEGAIFWCEDTCFPSRSRVEFDIDGRLLAGIWNRGGGSGRVVEKGRDVDLFELQFWSPRPPPVSPLQEPLRPGAKGFPGGVGSLRGKGGFRIRVAAGGKKGRKKKSAAG